MLLIACSGAWAQKSPKKDYLFVLSTKFGEIHFVLFDETPVHKQNFYKLSKSQVYDSTTFHRVIKNFMIQGGDPSSKVTGQTEKVEPPNENNSLPAEIVPQFRHVRGMIAAARLGDAINPQKRSSPSQFYIVQNHNGAHHLDGAYTIFGVTLKGMDVVDKIAEQPVNPPASRPVSDIRMAITVQEMSRKKIAKLYNYSYPVAANP